MIIRNCLEWIDGLCKRHAPDPGASSSYATATGLQEYGKKWQWELKMTAKHSVWLREACEPCDLGSFLEHGQKITHGLTEWDGATLLHLTSFAGMKWPVAVESYARRTSLESAAQFRQCLLGVASDAAEHNPILSEVRWGLKPSN